jgi:hypothetical protein
VLISWVCSGVQRVSVLIVVGRKENAEEIQ